MDVELLFSNFTRMSQYRLSLCVSDCLLLALEFKRHQYEPKPCEGHLACDNANKPSLVEKKLDSVYDTSTHGRVANRP